MMGERGTVTSAAWGSVPLDDLVHHPHHDDALRGRDLCDRGGCGRRVEIGDRVAELAARLVHERADLEPRLAERAGDRE